MHPRFGLESPLVRVKMIRTDLIIIVMTITSLAFHLLSFLFVSCSVHVRFMFGSCSVHVHTILSPRGRIDHLANSPVCLTPGIFSPSGTSVDLVVLGGDLYHWFGSKWIISSSSLFVSFFWGGETKVWSGRGCRGFGVWGYLHA